MIRIWRRAALASLMIGVVLPGTAPALAAAAQADAAHARPGAENWRIVHWFPRDTGIEAVAAVSRTDAWAVGSAGKSGSAAVFRWRGKAWRRVEVPGLDPHLALMNVAATSASDVWIFAAVPGTGQDVVLRYDGTSWSSVPAPADSLDESMVVVLGADNAWWADSSGGTSSIVWHWTGTSWQPVPVTGFITGVAGAGHALWLATQPSGSSPAQTTILRWTGSEWQNMTFPDTRRLYWPQVAVAPDGQAWVQDAPRHGRWSVYHWTGRNWHQIMVPARASGRTVFMADVMTFDGHRGIWSEGTVHWTGRRWIVPSISPASRALTILAMQGPVAPIPGTTGTWGIGFVATSRAARPKYRYFLAIEGIAP